MRLGEQELKTEISMSQAVRSGWVVPCRHVVGPGAGVRSTAKSRGTYGPQGHRSPVAALLGQPRGCEPRLPCEIWEAWWVVWVLGRSCDHISVFFCPLVPKGWVCPGVAGSRSRLEQSQLWLSWADC